MQAKVSVIVPIYNTSQYLNECLESLVAQTLKDIEIIMIDDGSTDDSFEIANGFCAKDDRFFLKHTENKGLSAARNAGLEIAKGEYVYFLDSDDYLAHDAMEVLYERAKKDDLDVLKFSAYVFEDGKTEYIWRYWQDNFGYKYHGEYPDVYTGTEIFKRFVDLNDYYSSSCLVFTKRIFLEQYKLRFYEGILNEDHLFHFESMMYAKKVGVLNRPLYYRRIRQGSIMKSNQWIKKISSLSIIIKKTDGYVKADDSLKEMGGWLIMLLFNTMLEQWEKMTLREQFSKSSKKCVNRIKPIILQHTNSRRIRLFCFSLTAFRIYEAFTKQKILFTLFSAYPILVTKAFLL